MTTPTLANYIARYRSDGFTPIPLHEVNNGACSCSKGSRCTSAGKHPRINSTKDAIAADDKTWADWIRRWPNMNVGLLTGPVSGIVVLDIDPRNSGDISLQELLTMHQMPTTVSAKTGGDGWHYFFKQPEGMCIKCRSGLMPGIDIRGEGGLIVVAPSRTKGDYSWQ